MINWVFLETWTNIMPLWCESQTVPGRSDLYLDKHSYDIFLINFLIRIVRVKQWQEGLICVLSCLKCRVQKIGKFCCSHTNMIPQHKYWETAVSGSSFG